MMKVYADVVTRETIERAGGLATVGDLERLWNVSKTRVHQIVNHPAFPEPLARVGQAKVWLVSEAEAFRHDEERRPGRPWKGAVA